MGLKNPVGSVIKYANQPLKIIGVMEDFVMESPYKGAEPMAISYNMEEIYSIIARLNPNQNISIQSIRSII